MPALLRRRAEISASPEQLQSDFYTATAEEYDEQFVQAGDYHSVALDFISALIDGYGYKSVLDVGTGTGRALRHLMARHGQQLELRGVEPVRALIDQAERLGVPPGLIAEGDGYKLPFDDDSFDVVCEFAVLHHVAEPNPMVAEMVRVARRAVFLSDENRFGNGGRLRRGAKYALYSAGLWPVAWRIRNRGRPYLLNDGDGRVAYSYSLYDSLETLNRWADRTFFVPLEPAAATRFHPLFGAQHLLLAGLRSD